MKAKLAILKAHGGPNFERTRDSLVSDAHLFQQMVELKRRSVYSQNYRPADDANVIMAIPTIVLWKSPSPFFGRLPTGTITGMTWEKSSLRMCFMRMCSGH